MRERELSADDRSWPIVLVQECPQSRCTSQRPERCSREQTFNRVERPRAEIDCVTKRTVNARTERRAERAEKRALCGSRARSGALLGDPMTTKCQFILGTQRNRLHLVHTRIGTHRDACLDIAPLRVPGRRLGIRLDDVVSQVNGSAHRPEARVG